MSLVTSLRTPRLPLRALLGALCLSVTLSTARAANSEGGRVIMLGFDGADARTTQQLMDAGQLPNLKRLAADGTFEPLVSTNPAESAAGWAAINTGVTPVDNGVPSFVVRNFSSSGSPMVGAGHTTTKTIPIEDFELGGVLGILAGNDPLVVSAAAAGGAFLLFFLVFAFLLRVRKAIAFVLALVLGGVGGWGTHKASGYVPSQVSGVHKNNVKAPAFWDHAARAGVESIALEAALAFDRPATPGARVLGGLGLPDARGGGNGEWFIYTTDDLELGRVPEGDTTSSGAGTIFRVDERGGEISTFLYGPENFWERDQLEQKVARLEERLASPDLGWQESNSLRDELEAAKQDLNFGLTERRCSVPMTIRKEDGGARVSIGGQEQRIEAGGWSDWYHVTFQINPLIQVKAVTRLKILRLDDPFELYVNNLEIDPSSPPFYQPVASPSDFSGTLADWIGGPYETTGWACQTNQLKDKRLDPGTFLEDIEFTMEFRKKLTFAALEKRDWRLLFSVFSTTDRVQHMLYKYYDPEHPLHDSEEAEQEVTFYGESIKLKDAIPAIYRQMDKIVGEVMQTYMEPDDVLMLCADHGFSSFRRGLHVNNWLARDGFLVLKDGVRKSDASSLGSYVDWSRTQAYSLGLGMVFLNLEGRERGGIVKQDEADQVLAELQQSFLALTDTGERRGEDLDESVIGTKVGLDATVMKDVYPGNWGSEEYQVADLMLGFDQNYRVSWSTVMGKIKLAEQEDGSIGLGDLFEDNPQNWSGDHASNSPHLVTGIFFSNEKVRVPEDGVSVLHLAPTILDRLGVPIPSELAKPALATN